MNLRLTILSFYVEMILDNPKRSLLRIFCCSSTDLVVTIYMPRRLLAHSFCYTVHFKQFWLSAFLTGSGYTLHVYVSYLSMECIYCIRYVLKFDIYRVHVPIIFYLIYASCNITGAFMHPFISSPGIR